MLFSAPLSPAGEPAESGGKSPAEMTVAELRELAKALGIRGYSTMDKAGLIAAVNAAQEG